MSVCMNVPLPDMPGSLFYPRLTPPTEVDGLPPHAFTQNRRTAAVAGKSLPAVDMETPILKRNPGALHLAGPAELVGDAASSV